MKNLELLKAFEEVWENLESDALYDLEYTTKDYKSLFEYSNQEEIEELSDKLGPFRVVDNVTTTDGDAHFIVHLKEHDTFRLTQ